MTAHSGVYCKFWFEESQTGSGRSERHLKLSDSGDQGNGTQGLGSVMLLGVLSSGRGSIASGLARIIVTDLGSIMTEI